MVVDVGDGEIADGVSITIKRTDERETSRTRRWQDKALHIDVIDEFEIDLSQGLVRRFDVEITDVLEPVEVIDLLWLRDGIGVSLGATSTEIGAMDDAGHILGVGLVLDFDEPSQRWRAHGGGKKEHADPKDHRKRFFLCGTESVEFHFISPPQSSLEPR